MYYYIYNNLIRNLFKGILRIFFDKIKKVIKNYYPDCFDYLNHS